MKILAIDTSCDETAVAVTQDLNILSNVIWSQASLHAEFGGVMPALAQREHQKRINWVVEKALKDSGVKIGAIDSFAVTTGPGLSIALSVGIEKAKELAKKYKKTLIAVNHLEGHVLSPLAKNGLGDIKFPALGLVISGGNTILVKINKIGDYETLAATTDDALGEALDKAARMLGLGYPGGAILEKLAREGELKKYSLPIPLVGQEKRKIFSYSGLKAAMYRLVEKEKPLTKEKIENLAVTFQDIAFKHLTRIISYVVTNSDFKPKDFLIGGGVAANIEVRKRLRGLGKQFGIKTHFPYSKKLYGDNAAMMGIAAYFKAQRKEFADPSKINQDPRLSI
jgi:N6-L-threonylcarbamoyladenine synthase